MTRQALWTRTAAWLCAGGLCSLAALWSASDFGVRVIAHPAVAASEMSAGELKAVFLLTKTTLNGRHVEPVLDAGMLRVFSGGYLGKTEHALEVYYRSLVFAGKGSMPVRFGSGADVVEYVARTPGAIGYVSDGTQTAGVKILRIR